MKYGVRIEIFLISKNILFLKNKYNVDLIKVPKNLRKKVIPLYHDLLTAGHLRFDKAFAAINNQFYLPKMKTEIFDYCESDIR